MQNIDFLPSRYRERQLRRKTRMLQLSVLVMFVLAVAAAAGGQLALRRAVKNDLDAVVPRYSLAAAHHAEVRDVRQRLEEAQQAAELHAYLQHPWPRTQLLAAIVETLPDSIALTELTLTSEPIARGTAGTNQTRLQTVEDDNLPPIQRDLRELRQRGEREVSVMEMSGRSRDATQLHAFVARLDSHPLIESAKLESLESRSGSGDASFVVRVTVRKVGRV